MEHVNGHGCVTALPLNTVVGTVRGLMKRLNCVINIHVPLMEALLSGQIMVSARARVVAVRESENVHVPSRVLSMADGTVA